MIPLIGLITGPSVSTSMTSLRPKSALKSALLLIRNTCRGKNKIIKVFIPLKIHVICLNFSVCLFVICFKAGIFRLFISLLLYGVVCTLSERNEAAETFFEAATCVDPKSILAWTMLGICHICAKSLKFLKILEF